MRALVTGAEGQLGVELLRAAPPAVTVVGVGHRELDITNPASVEAAMRKYGPKVVINAAAYTAVDQAESEADLAHMVNDTGAGNVARGASAVKARVIQVSTDYVFDGTSRAPYRPDSAPNPINVYGASKLAGEHAIMRNASDSLIIRSSWVYAAHGKNFFRTILAALQASKSLRVVNDQTGAPTAARSLAQAIWACAQRPELRGVQHWVDDGTATWFDFAAAIQEAALNRGLLSETVPITPVSSDEYAPPARRPAYSVLDASGLSGLIGQQPRPWRTWVGETIAEIR